MGLTRAKITNVDTSIEMIADPITILNSGSNNANVDVGFLVNRANGLLANTAIYWNESGNSFITAFTSNTGGTNTNITVTSYANVTTGHHLPGANVTYDLGSSTQRWRTLYISGSTIVMGSSTISTDNSGNFSFSTTGGTPLNGQFATVVSNTINAATIGNSGATLTGTISTAAQPNITSTGTLNGITVYSSTGGYFANISATAAPGYGSIQTWKFFTQTSLGGGPGSWILFPDNTTQTTSYPGTSTTLALSGTINAGTLIATAVNAPTIGNTSAALVGSTGTFSGTVIASTVNAATIGNTGAVHTGSSLTLTSYANIAGAAVFTNNNAVASMQVTGTATKGGAGYHDFLSVTNQGSGVTNPNKYFRMNSTGNFEIINSDYSTNIFTLTNDGNITIPGKVTVNALYTSTGLFWAGNNNVISTGGGGGSTPAGSTGQVQYNNGGTLGASGLYYYSGNSSIVATGGVASTSTTAGTLQVLGSAGFTGNVVADQVWALNNGNGTNFRIGDDTYLGDINIANTTRLTGLQDGTQAYIVFGNSNATNYIGRSGTNPITVTGAFSITGTTTAAAITSSGTITAATVNAATIGNTGATLTGTISTAAQTNITSVGTLTSLNVGAVTSSGTIIAATVNAATIGNTSAALVGATGTFSGTVVAATVNAATIGNTGATLTGTISTAAQTNITSVGNLTSVSIAGTSTHYGAASFYTAPVPGANVAVNLGSTTAWWSTIYGKATQAQYADLAENYTSDDNYPPGTVVVFGGEQEITVTDKIADTRVAGVISTNPAYLMNAVVEGLPVAFTGRVPCQVKGPVNKGDVLVTSNIPGVAQRIGIDWQPGCVLGKALGSINSNNIETIEVVVGRF